MRDDMTKITITKETHEKIKALAEKKGLKQVTVLEYLLKGKIDLTEI